jgi:hypothetical protein
MRSMVHVYFKKLKERIKRCSIISIFKPEVVFVKDISVFNSISVFSDSKEIFSLLFLCAL